ncbi:MAG TPA: hypothetical protein DEQ43_13630 [Nocardioides bacterium]|nr:hypothetical protein [Nocardioides sp.]
MMVEPGLHDSEFERIESSLGFLFGDEHRALLAEVLPVGENWPHWRRLSVAEAQKWLGQPTAGIVFDVRENDFWPAAWGQRPSDRSVAEDVARHQLARAPQLVPIWGHRFVPAAPAPVPSPVFSVWGTDVIYYGDNLLDYVAYEFRTGPRQPTRGGPRRVPFWSDLAERT